MPGVFDDLAHGEVVEAVAGAVILHRVAVVARQPGRIEREPDVAEMVLHDLLHAGRRERRDLIVGREVREGELLRCGRQGHQQHCYEQGPNGHGPSLMGCGLQVAGCGRLFPAFRNPHPASSYHPSVARFRDWFNLGRNTVSSLKTSDLTSLYSVEWPETKRILTAEHRELIDGERKRVRRWIRTVSAILFGLTKKLAPHRRVLFLIAFIFFFASLVGIFQFRKDFFWVVACFLIVVLLLAMELIDKIKYRDELELA